MKKKPNHSLKNSNRWLYVGFVALGVMAIWFGVLLGNFLLNRVANADPTPSSNQSIVANNLQTDDYSSNVQPVSQDYPDNTPLQSSQLYRVRVGRYTGLSIAKKAESELKALGLDTYVLGSGTGPYYVQVGAFREHQNAEKLANELRSKGYEVFVMQ